MAEGRDMGRRFFKVMEYRRLAHGVSPGFKGKSMPALTLSAAAGGDPQRTSPTGDAKGRRHPLPPGSRIPSQRRRHEASW